MLFYNPDNRTEKLDELERWLEGKDPDEEYCYTDSNGCAMEQFHQERGSDYSAYDAISAPEHTFKRIAEKVANRATVFNAGVATFSAMLKLLRKHRLEIGA